MRKRIRSTNPATQAPEIDDPIEGAIARARRLRKRGDLRGALVVLREAASRDEWRARCWTLLGALLGETGKRDEAARAFKHARWLRVRAGETARAQVTQRLLERCAA